MNLERRPERSRRLLQDFRNIDRWTLSLCGPDQDQSVPVEREREEKNQPEAAALRISGEKPLQRVLGDQDWTWIEFSFEVEATEEVGDLKVGLVDLICELQSPRGTAWFDEDSLELIRGN